MVNAPDSDKSPVPRRRASGIKAMPGYPWWGGPGVLGGIMRNSWIFEVLADLRAFATVNDLPKLARKIAEAERTAHAEIAEKGGAGPQDP